MANIGNAKGIITITRTYDYMGYIAHVDCYINNDNNITTLTAKQLQNYIKEGYLIIDKAEKPKRQRRYIHTYILQKSAYYVDKQSLDKNEDYLFYIIIDKQSIKNEELMNKCKIHIQNNFNTRNLKVYRHPNTSIYGLPLEVLGEIIRENRLYFVSCKQLNDNSPEFLCKMHKEYDNNRDYYILINFKDSKCSNDMLIKEFENDILPGIQNLFHSKYEEVIGG